MADNRCSCGQGGSSSGLSSRDTICIDTYRVLDSCRDKDCYEDVRVFLCEDGQSIIDRTTNIRTTGAEIVCASINVNPVQFNRGFYQITIRFYIKLCFEACINGRSQCFEGMSVVEKTVVLYGGEGNVNIYKSTPDGNGYCAECTTANRSSNLPIGVAETVSPVVLSVKVAEPNSCCNCYCCCSCSDIPEAVADTISGGLIDSENNRLYVSLGIFYVVRIERPAQYLITATDYCVPDKECVTSECDNPCSIFRNMAFPTNEFCARSFSNDEKTGNSCR